MRPEIHQPESATVEVHIVSAPPTSLSVICSDMGEEGGTCIAAQGFFQPPGLKLGGLNELNERFWVRQSVECFDVAAFKPIPDIIWATISLEGFALCFAGMCITVQTEPERLSPNCGTIDINKPDRPI